MDCLEGRAGPQARVAGAVSDLRAIAAVMREPRIGTGDPVRGKTKLENVFATRYARDKLAAMDSLIRQHAFLSGLRLRDGSSVPDMRERVNAILDLKQAVASLRSGRRESGLLSTVLEQMHILARHREDVEVDLESLLSGRPDLVGEGLRWAVTHGQAGLFYDLLEARAACIDAEFVDEFLPLALESCAAVAMDLLAAAYPDATLTDRIVQGIRQGASGRVLSAWLIELHWCTDVAAMKLVLRQLQQKGRLAFVLRALATHAPEVLARTLPVLAMERQGFKEEAAMLLAFAARMDDAGLYWLVERHLPRNKT